MMNMIPTRSMRAMNPFFPFDDGFFRPLPENRAPMRVDVKDASDKYVIEAELPGVSRENITVSIKDGLLDILVESKQEEEKNDESGYIRRERRLGRMERSFRLDGIDEQNVSAEFKDGLLTVNLPKEAENEEVRKIEIA